MASAFAQSGSRAEHTDPEGGAAAPQTQTWTQPRRVATTLAEALHPNGAAFAGPAPLASAPRFVSTDELPEGDMPRELAFTPDGQFVVIANRDTDTATFLDVSTRTIVATVDVGDFPVSVAVSNDGAWAIVTNVLSDDVTIIDVATRTAAVTLPITGQQPYRVEISADSQFAVVGVVNDAVSSAFSIISLSTLTEVRTIPSTPQGAIGFFATPEIGAFGNLFTQFALSPDSRTAVLPDRGNNLVSLYDITTGATLASLATASGPTSIDIDPLGTFAVLGHEGAVQTITRVDLAARTITNTFATGVNLSDQHIRVTPDGSHAMASVQNALIFVNLSTGVVTNTISTGIVGDIEISFDGQFAFVSNFNARVIDIASQTLVRTIPFEAGAEAATSPTGHRAVMLDNRFRENAIVFNINGAAGALEGKAQSGAPNEGDATRSLGISPDGRTVIASNIVSENVAILDFPAETVRAYVTTGDRVWDGKVTPDGTYAVVTNTDASTVSIIDLATDTRVAHLSVPTRPTEVVIAPDSGTAYVTTIAGTDRIAIINLNGAASSIVASIPSGQLGSIGYTYGVSSGMELSPDGSVLAVCVSFDDQLLLIDTATRAVLTRVPVGDFPVRVAFAPGGGLAYVAHSFSDDVDVVAIAGAASTVIATVPNIDFPLTVDVDPAGTFVYVGSFGVAPGLFVIDATTNTVVRTVPLPSAPRATHYSAVDDVLYVALTGEELVRVQAAGAASALIDSAPLSGSPADLVFSESLRRAIVAQPGARDGVDVVSYGGVFSNYGAGFAGSGGIVPQIAGNGVPTLGATVSVDVTQGRGAAPGTILVGLASAAFPFFGGQILVSPFADAPHVLSGAAGVAGAGAFSLSLPLGNDPGFFGLRVFFQGVFADPGAAQGLSFTGGLEMLID